jgi:2-isopropylmalate synthase
MYMARIQIYDTTLRDGSQGEGVSFSLQDKLLITRRLDELGVDFIEGGYPYSNPKDAEFFKEACRLPLSRARLCAFGMTRRKGVTPDQDTGMDALKNSGAPVATIVGKTWDLHVNQVISTTLDENLKMIHDSLKYLKECGQEVLYDAEHFFDGYRANPEYSLATLKAAEAAGAAVIILCDTNGGTLPDQIAEIVRRVRQTLRTTIGIHCHNDCDLAVANSLAAIDAGAEHVQGTINGIGERCGNADLISVLANLGLKKGHDVLKPGSLGHLTEISRYVYEIANMNFRSNQPFVGASAFAHKGGMHVHAVNKIAASYEHLDPALVGNERRILVSELSGQSNILAKTTKYRITHDRALMAKILDRVCALENEGYEFEAAEASFDILVKQVLGLYRPCCERLGYHVSVEMHANSAPTTEGTVKVRVKDTIQHTVSEGDGPVNALDGALRKALIPFYPRLHEMQLVDYKVRVVNSRAGTAARVRVVIESRDESDMWGTVGVSENIIEASWLALMDSIEYKIFKDQESQISNEKEVLTAASV